jgi:amino acid adenylation domain-containing protein
MDTGRGLVGVVSYSRDLFEKETIERLMRHYTNALRGIVCGALWRGSLREGGERPISELSLLSDEEREQIVVEWNESERPYPQDQCIHELFRERAERGPERIALLDESQQVSYGELNRRANQLGRYLQGLGVGPETVVGLCLERSAEMVLALLGALKAGGAYLPLDPESPLERLGYLLEDGGVGVVLTERKLEKRLPSFWGQTVCLDLDWERISRESESEPESTVTPENLAYLIYTSGSTGRPKGVMVRHRSLVNYTFEICRRLRLTEEMVEGGLQFATVSTITADLGNTCIYPSLVSGGCLHIMSYGVATDGMRFEEYLGTHPIDVLKIVPSHLSALLAAQPKGARMLPLKHLILGGEALSSELSERIRERGEGCEVIHHYGPTETTIGSLMTRVSEEEVGGRGRASVPIGRPIANTEVYILDRELDPAPVGVRGELCIAGSGLARGYVGRPEFTAERFIPDLLGGKEGARLYRTGDVCRYLPSGMIEFLGRVDDQVKARGYRIELREIQAVLNEHRLVKESVVVMKDDEKGGKRLLGYVVGEEGATDAEIKRNLRERLPEYMIPEAILLLEEIPLTANGKVDRKKLPDVKDGGGRPEQEYMMTRTPIEEILLGVFEEVLKVERVRREDNFFDLGGHSLLAMQVVSRVRKVFGVEIGVVSIFEEATVEGLAQRIEEAMEAEAKREAPPLVKAPRNERRMLSFAQQRLWFWDQLTQNQPAYTVSVAVRLEGGLDLKVLEKVVNEIVRRHEVLRTRIDIEERAPIQVIEEWKPRKLEVKDLRNFDLEVKGEAVGRIIREEAGAGLDLRRGPLLRVKVLKLDVEQHVLLFTMHRIIGDTWSVQKLTREVVEIYEAMSNGLGSPLPELEIQYADYAYWQRQYLTGDMLEKRLAYWKKRLAGKLPRLDLPVDHARPSGYSHRVKTKSFSLPVELGQSLRRLGRREGVTLSMVLLAAFKTLLYRYTAQEDIIVGTEIADKLRREVIPLIGPFVNMLPMRTNLGGNPKFRELLRRVKEVVLEGYVYQNLPFEKLIEDIKLESAVKDLSLFKVAFGAQSAQRVDLNTTSIKIEPLAAEHGLVNFDLGLWVIEGGNGIQVRWVYHDDLFEEGTIIRMQNHFEALLFNVVDRPDARILSIKVSSRMKPGLSHKEQSDLNDFKSRKLKSVERKGINLPTEPS